jgi:hypothetical protein
MVGAGTAGAGPSLPAALPLCPCLRYCRVLDGNAFSGELPEAWTAAGAFPSLRRLELKSNLLAGPLPVPEGWPKLETLLLEGNNFTGELPVEWAHSSVLPAIKIM